MSNTLLGMIVILPVIILYSFIFLVRKKDKKNVLSGPFFSFKKLLVALLVLLLLGLPGYFFNDIHTIIGCQVFIALVLVIVFFAVAVHSRGKDTVKPSSEEMSPAAPLRSVPPAPAAPPSDAPAAPPIRFPSSIGSASVTYQYDDVPLIPCVSPVSSLIGKMLHFQADGDQVDVLTNGRLIGTMKPGRLCRMVTDWLSRGDPIRAAVTSVNDETHSVSFGLYFYRDEMQYLLRKNPDAKMYKLTGNRGGEMQESASYSVPGSECSVEYDYEKEKYVVSDGSEIGYLPASAARYAEECEEGSVRVFIADVETDDEGKTVVFVYLFH